MPSNKPREFNLVRSDGKREPQHLTQVEALKFATVAANAFGIAEGKEVVFDPKLALLDIKGEGDTKQTRKKAAKKAESATETPEVKA